MLWNKTSEKIGFAYETCLLSSSAHCAHNGYCVKTRSNIVLFHSSWEDPIRMPPFTAFKLAPYLNRYLSQVGLMRILASSASLLLSHVDKVLIVKMWESSGTPELHSPNIYFSHVSPCCQNSFWSGNIKIELMSLLMFSKQHVKGSLRNPQIS